MQRSETSFVTGESPLTDLRSLASSVLFHSILLLVLWLVVGINAVMPATESAAQPIRTEIGPVDNRADANAAAGEGGGSPGEIGGLSKIALTSPDARNSVAASRDPADALLAEILPELAAAGGGDAPEGLAGSADDRAGADPGLGLGRRRGLGGRLGGRRGAGRRARHPVLRRPRSCPFLRLRDRLLREHGHAELAGDRQARAARQPQPAPARRRVRGGVLQLAGEDAQRSPGPQGADGGDDVQQDADPGPARGDPARRRDRPHVGPARRPGPEARGRSSSSPTPT